MRSCGLHGRSRDGRLRFAQRLGRGAQCGLGAGELVGSGIAGSFGVGLGAEQALAAFFEGGDDFLQCAMSLLVLARRSSRAAM